MTEGDPLENFDRGQMEAMANSLELEQRIDQRVAAGGSDQDDMLLVIRNIHAAQKQAIAVAETFAEIARLMKDMRAKIEALEARIIELEVRGD